MFCGNIYILFYSIHSVRPPWPQRTTSLTTMPSINQQCDQHDHNEPPAWTSLTIMYQRGHHAQLEPATWPESTRVTTMITTNHHRGHHSQHEPAAWPECTSVTTIPTTNHQHAIMPTINQQAAASPECISMTTMTTMNHRTTVTTLPRMNQSAQNVTAWPPWTPSVTTITSMNQQRDQNVPVWPSCPPKPPAWPSYQTETSSVTRFSMTTMNHRTSVTIMPNMNQSDQNVPARLAQISNVTTMPSKNPTMSRQGEHQDPQNNHY